MTLTWRRTFPGTHYDFAADAPEGHVGRVMKQALHGLGTEVWAWSASGVFATRADIGPLDGECETRIEAIEALTDAYHRARAWSARTGRPALLPPPPEIRPIVWEFP